MMEVEVCKFSDEDFRNDYLIMTPTGFKKVDGYEDLAKQNCITISFGDSFNTTVTSGHKIQLENGTYVTVDKLKIGDKIKMYDDVVEVTDITDKSDVDCCAINLEGDEYYLDGTVSM